MKNRLLLIVLLLSTNISFAQKNTLTFPEGFLGIYKGKLAIHQANDEIKEIPMEFHLLETDTVKRFIIINTLVKTMHFQCKTARRPCLVATQFY